MKTRELDVGTVAVIATAMCSRLSFPDPYAPNLLKSGKGQIPGKKHRSKQERNVRKRIRKARRKNRTT